MKRQPRLSERMAEHIKRVRAGVDEDTIKAYFDKLKVSLQDVPKCNILNYDETAFVDDVGAQKVRIYGCLCKFH